MFVIVILILLITVLVLWDFQQKWKYRSLSHMPGPKPLFLLGNALEFGLNPADIYKDIERILKCGTNVKLNIGPVHHYVALIEPESVEFFISSMKFIKKSPDYNLFRPWIDNGLLTSTGSYWQKRRKMITPTFHFKILDEFIPIINSGTEILVQQLAKEVDKDVTNIYPYITLYTLDTICETAMGTSIKAQQNSTSAYPKAVQDLCRIIVERVFSPWKNIDILFKLTKQYKDQQRCLNTIHTFVNSVIANKRKELRKTKDMGMVQDDLGIKKRIAFLDMLLSATIDGKPLTDNDIREEVNTFMFEGHDTTASAIAFALYELARNPEVQNAAMKEILEIFGENKTREPTMTDLNNMKYLELVIKETLRLYPSVPIIGRALAEDVVYKNVLYPKGLNLVFIVVNMQRQESLYKNAGKFIPERFLPEKCEVKNPFSFIPFSAGPRNCIGQKFAMFELKSSISKILRHYELLPADPKYDVILSTEVILKSANGVNLRLKHRKY